MLIAALYLQDDSDYPAEQGFELGYAHIHAAASTTRLLPLALFFPTNVVEALKPVFFICFLRVFFF